MHLWGFQNSLVLTVILCYWLLSCWTQITMPKTYSSDLVRNIVWQSNSQRCCQRPPPNIVKSTTALQEGQQELSLAIFAKLFLSTWASMCLHILKTTCICMPLKLAPRKMCSGTSVCLRSHHSLAWKRISSPPQPQLRYWHQIAAPVEQTGPSPHHSSSCSHLSRLQLLLNTSLGLPTSRAPFLQLWLRLAERPWEPLLSFRLTSRR